MSEKTVTLPTHVNATTEMFHLEYEWKVVNYSILNMSTSRGLKSPIFSPSEDPNIKWFLKLYPNGDCSKSKDFVSIFPYFCPTESRKEISAQFELVMIGEQDHSIMKKSKWHNFNKDLRTKGYSQFIKKDLLKNGTFLSNDCLTIVCNITGYLSTEAPPNKLTGYQKLFENKELADIVLTASDGKVLHAHKVILAAHSPVFLAMFTNNMKETITGEVSIPDVQFNVLQEVLRFIYYGTVENMEKCIYDLLAVSNKYNIESLKFECEKFLSQNIEIDTVIEVLSLADTYDAANLRKHAIDFFVLHKREIVGTENFKSFSKLQPDLIEELTRELIIRT